MIRFLDELNVGVSVQRHDLGVIQPDRGLPVCTGNQGFATGKAHIVQQKAGSTENVQDIHRTLMTEQPDGGSFVGVGSGDSFEGYTFGGADCDKRDNQ